MPKNYNPNQFPEQLEIAISAHDNLLRSLVDEMVSLKTQMDVMKRQLDERMTYLEFDLHSENGRLKDKLSGWYQQPNSASEDYISNQDSFERKY